MRLSWRVALVVAAVAGCTTSPETGPTTVTALGEATTTSTGTMTTISALSLSDLGGTIVFSAEAASGHDVFRLRVGDDSEPVSLTTDEAKEFDPALSPNGSFVAYRRNPRVDSDEADIWIMGVDGAGKQNLTASPELSNWAPVWVPDGRIAFSSTRGNDQGMLELWTMEPDGSDVSRVVEGWCEYAHPSPTGEEFVCAASVGGRYDLVIVSQDGERRALTATPETEFGPSWSPDGQWITFSRDVAGRWQLLRIRPDGTDETVLAPEGVFSAWDTDGHVAWTGPGGINVALADGSGRVVLDYPGEFISWGD